MTAAKVPELPTEQNIRSLTDFIKDTERQCYDALNTDATLGKWRRLAEVTLAYIVCFNKRRSGEAGRMKLKDFNQRSTKCGPEATKTNTSLESAVEANNKLTHLLVEGNLVTSREMPIQC